MSQLSASQEMELEYLPCHVPGLPPVAIRRRAMEGIQREVSETFAAAPHRCAETGGILLGRREADRILVEDFEPVPSEHQFGPCYRLSDADRELLRETVEWFRSGAQPGLSVLGFYRSHTLPDFDLGTEDDELRTQFAADEDLVLLVKPGLMGINDADFSILRASAAGQPMLPEQPALPWPAPPRHLSMIEPESETATGTLSRRRWLWYTAAVTAGLLGGALLYLQWHADRGPERIAAAAPAPQVARPILEGTPAPPEQPTAPAPAAPAQLQPDTAGLHQFLDRWATALKRDDLDAAAGCYAPIVSTYFNRHNVTREAVRQSIRLARARYGRLDIYRLSGLTITPVSENRAIATFRKHWQTSGRRRFAGEEDERMTLVRTDGAWQISSEQIR